MWKYSFIYFELYYSHIPALPSFRQSVIFVFLLALWRTCFSISCYWSGDRCYNTRVPGISRFKFIASIAVRVMSLFGQLLSLFTCLHDRFYGCHARMCLFSLWIKIQLLIPSRLLLEYNVNAFEGKPHRKRKIRTIFQLSGAGVLVLLSLLEK